MFFDTALLAQKKKTRRGQDTLTKYVKKFVKKNTCINFQKLCILSEQGKNVQKL